MLMTKIFGFVIAFAALATSALMALMGEKFQKVEQAAYTGERRPWWFWTISAAIIVFYVIALVSFVGSQDKSIAGWILMVVLPLGWGLKAILIIFNKKGREKVTSISGDESWRKVALARLPIAVVVGILAILA